MTCSSSRFHDAEGGGFPVVSNYDYVENLNTRGSQNLTFRWEEVVIDSIYQFQEVTTSGSLEVNAFTYTGTSPYLIATPSTEFSGWYVDGDSAYYVGVSGTSFLTYGNAYPIDGESAVLFFATGSDVSISYTGLAFADLEASKKHQFYFVSRSLSGESTVTPYIIGYNAGTPVAYYDPFSGSWQASAPTGTYPVYHTGYTEIIFNFYPEDFPSTTPDAYSIVVSQLSGTTYPIIVDDIHVDKYMAKNAFVDYTLPTGYMIQITPDLGWHDIRAMFQDTEQNPYLKTFGIFDFANGNLEDRYDGTVLATLDSSQIDEAILPRFRNYLWRAIAVSPNGSLGDGGLPQKFKYIGDIFNTEFSVTKVLDDPLSVTKLVYGTRSSRMTILVDGQESTNISYPSDTTWLFSYNLSSDKIRVAFQARDIGGALSSIQYIELSSVVYSQNHKALWNVFDEFGLLMDLKRLPEETNDAYKERIKDVVRNPGGSTFRGVVNGATRELGLSKISNAFSITSILNTYSRGVSNELDVEVTGYSFLIRNETFLITEYKRIDPHTGLLRLSKQPRYNSIIIYTPDGNRIKDRDREAFHQNEEYPDVVDILIKDMTLWGDFVKVTYEYYEELLFNQYPTLYDLKIGIESVTDPSNKLIAEVTINETLSGTESTSGLFKTSLIIPEGVSQSIDWSPIYLNKMSDRKYRVSFVNDDRTFYNTKYYEYVKELQRSSHVFWKYIETDKDYWVSQKITDEGLDDIPTLTDPTMFNFVINTTGQAESISSYEAWYRGYTGLSGDVIVNNGLSYKDFQDGVCGRYDLMPDVYYLPKKNSSEEEDNIIGPQKNDNKYLIFSGQR